MAPTFTVNRIVTGIKQRLSVGSLNSTKSYFPLSLRCLPDSQSKILRHGWGSVVTILIYRRLLRTRIVLPPVSVPWWKRAWSTFPSWANDTSINGLWRDMFQLAKIDRAFMRTRVAHYAILVAGQCRVLYLEYRCVPQTFT